MTSDGESEGGNFGNEFFYTRWTSGEPNNSGWNEGCALINMDEGGMNDIPCARKFAYTCAKTISFGEEHTNDEERCMCTATGLLCEPKYTCTYFEKQREQASFEGAKEYCAQNSRTLAFFKTEEEFEQFLDDVDRDDDNDDSRGRGDEVQWIGNNNFYFYLISLIQVTSEQELAKTTGKRSTTRRISSPTGKMESQTMTVKMKTAQ